MGEIFNCLKNYSRDLVSDLHENSPWVLKREGYQLLYSCLSIISNQRGNLGVQKCLKENEYGIYVENLEAYKIFNVKTLRGSIDEKIHIHALFTHVKHILYS